MAEEDLIGSRPERFIYQVDKLEKAEVLRLVNKQKQIRYNEETSVRYSNLYKYAVEYSYNTNIHGIKYLIERRTKCEKIFWGVTILISLILSTIMIVEAISQLNQNSIIVSYNYYETLNTKISFPAVTICPPLDKISQYSQVFSSLMCEIKPEKVFKIEINQLKWTEIFKRSIDEVLVECKLFAKSVNCSNIFIPILTKLGVCFSFNLNYEARKDAPVKVLMSGRENGLKVILKSPKNISKILKCDQFYNHFKVVIDTPNVYPKPNRRYFLISKNSYLAVSLEPDLLETDPYVENLVISEKQCYQPNDINLDLFPFYTRDNCYLECNIKFLFARCGCIPFYLPGNEKFKVCELSHVICLQKAQEHFKKVVVSYRTRTSESYCKCKPLCRYLDYISNSVETSWNWKNLTTEVKSNEFDLCFLNVYFKRHAFHAMKKYSWLGIIDLIWTVGGYMSFFNGMSVLSILEIIYFFSLRIFCNKIKHGQWMHYRRPTGLY